MSLGQPFEMFIFNQIHNSLHCLTFKFFLILQNLFQFFMYYFIQINVITFIVYWQQTPTDDQQQDNAITSYHQETIGLPYVHQSFCAISATFVLTGLTNKPPNSTVPLISTFWRCNATPAMPKLDNSNACSDFTQKASKHKENPRQYLLIVYCHISSASTPHVKYLLTTLPL